jgi:hypothetical protein
MSIDHHTDTPSTPEVEQPSNVPPVEKTYEPLVFVKGGEIKDHKPWSRARKIAIGVGSTAAALAIAIPVFIGISNDSHTNNDPHAGGSPKPTASASANPEHTTAPSNGEKFVQTSEVVKPTLTVADMDAMDLNTFAQQSYANRYLYLHHYAGADLEGVTEAQDIGTTHPNAITNLFWLQIGTESIGQADTIRGAKMYSALDYYTTEADSTTISPNYQAVATSIEQNGGANVGLATGTDYVASGQWQHGVDRDNNKIDFQDITYNEGTTTSNTELTAQVIRVVIEIDGVDYVSYPIGYGVNGKAAPDSQYPY